MFAFWVQNDLGIEGYLDLHGDIVSKPCWYVTTSFYDALAELNKRIHLYHLTFNYRIIKSALIPYTKAEINLGETVCSIRQ